MRRFVARQWQWMGWVACLMLVAPGALRAADPPTAGVIDYAVDLADARNHFLTITAQFEADQPETELMMAVWTPGSYLVREYAQHIDSMTVTDAQGKPRAFHKVRKNRWRVDSAGTDSITVRYRLYCNDMSVRTNWVGLQYAMINGAPTFITVPDRLQQPHRVRLVMPKNWKRSATSLRQGAEPHQYVAANFDELVDSPIVAGNIHVYPFEAGGVEHQLVNIGESGYWDGATAATDLQKLVEEHQRMWGSIPYDRYLFLNMIVESGGGLEHDNSTLIMTSRWSFRDKGRYRSWLSLASHEFFHTWNVRRLRPKSLVRYDYENEVYTESLWIAEGITSYYQDLALVRAGLLSRNDYLSRLSGDVEGLQRTLGRTKQSLADSSYDAWIKYYRRSDNSSNTEISYYTKGAVAAFLLDVRIRKLTGGQRSLDDVLRIMFERYAGVGYTPDEFRAVASEVAGADLSDWFRRAIDSTEELDYSDLEFVGLEIPAPFLAQQKAAAAEEGDDPAEEGDDEDDEDEEDEEGDDDGDDDEDDAPAAQEAAAKPKGRPWVGLAVGSTGTVAAVTPDSPAYEAGINLGDEILAINDFRLAGSLDSRLSQFEIGDTLEVLLSRRGQLMRMNLTIGARESESWRLRYLSKPSDEQKQQLELWLEVPEAEEALEQPEAGESAPAGDAAAVGATPVATRPGN